MSKQKGVKAARTRAENTEHERQEGEHLVKQTESKSKIAVHWIDQNWTMIDSGGWAAKQRALENADKYCLCLQMNSIEMT